MCPVALELDLHEVTIIIPTYQRPTFLLRNLSFWSSTNVKIIVADGSPTSELSFLENGKHSVEYFRTQESMELRLATAASRVKTKYAIISGDDEFMLPKSISILQDFLNLNSDYVCCIGRCIAFEKRKSSKSKSPFLLLRPDKPGQANHQVNQTNSIERISYHISNYQVSTFYALHRSKNLASILNRVSTIKISSPYGAELFFETASAESGKSRVLSIPSWLRSSENTPVRSLIGDISLADWKRDFYPEVESAIHEVFGRDEDTEKQVGILINKRIDDQKSELNFLNWSKKFFKDCRTFLHYKRRGAIEKLAGQILEENKTGSPSRILKKLTWFQLSYFLTSSNHSFGSLKNSGICLDQDVGLREAFEFILTNNQVGRV